MLQVYDRARRDAMMNKDTETPTEVAERHGLDPYFAKVLISVIKDWGSDNNEFFERMKEVYYDTSAPIEVRALAAEHASNSCANDERVKWVAAALVLASRFENSEDCQILLMNTVFGLWHKGNNTLVPADVHIALDNLIVAGAYNAPGQVLWWVDNLELQFGEANGEDAKHEAVGWLGRVIDRANNEPHGMSEVGLRKALKKLTELIAG